LDWDSAGDLDQDIEDVGIGMRETSGSFALLWSLEALKMGVKGGHHAGLDLEEFLSGWVEGLLEDSLGMVDNSSDFSDFSFKTGEEFSSSGSIFNELSKSGLSFGKFSFFLGNCFSKTLNNWSINFDECRPLLLVNLSGVNIGIKTEELDVTSIRSNIVRSLKGISLV